MFRFEVFKISLGKALNPKLDLKVKFICSRIKKKEEAKGKNCHAKTMWSLEKPI